MIDQKAMGEDNSYLNIKRIRTYVTVIEPEVLLKRMCYIIRRLYTKKTTL